MAEIKHAVQLKLRVNPNQMDNFLKSVREEFFRGLREQRGIRRMYLLRGSEDQNNELLLWTLWDSKPAGDAYWASDSGRLAVEAVREILDSEPTLTEFAVELHDINAKGLAVSRSARQRMSGKNSPSSRKNKRVVRKKHATHKFAEDSAKKRRRTRSKVTQRK